MVFSNNLEHIPEKVDAPKHYLNDATTHLSNAACHVGDALLSDISASVLGSIAYAGFSLATAAIGASASPLASYVLSDASAGVLAGAIIATDSSVAFGAFGLSVGTAAAVSVAEELATNICDTVYHTGAALYEVGHAGYDVFQATVMGDTVDSFSVEA